MVAPRHADEEARLAALHRYNILDSPSEGEYDDITRIAAHICQAPIALISLVDRDRQFFKSEVGLGMRETPHDMSICAHAILQPDLFVVPDTTQDERFADNPLVTGNPHLRFYAGALLQNADGHALGTLCVLDYETRELTEEQKAVLTALANQVMAMMELRRLLARERNIAEILQRSILTTPAADMFPGLVIEPFYEAAKEEAMIGGDFYDAFTLPSGHAALVVGDVAGKGLAAAARTAEAKYALRVYLRDAPSPAEAVARLNMFLCDAQQLDKRFEDAFIALVVAVIDPASGDVTITTGGIETPVLARADGSTELIEQRSMPVGIDRDAPYTDARFRLESGDRLLMLTDGLTEARQGRELFGIENVSRLLSEHCRQPLPALIDTLVAQARAFANGTFGDDVCLLLVSRAG